MSCGSGLLEIKTGMIIAHGRVMEAIFNLLFVTKPHKEHLICLALIVSVMKHCKPLSHNVLC